MQDTLIEQGITFEMPENDRLATLAKSFNSTFRVPSQPRLLEFAGQQKKVRKIVDDENRQRNFADDERFALRYNGADDSSSIPRFPPEYMGKLREMEFHDGVSLLSTPQIESLLGYLRDVWIQVKHRQIKSSTRERLNYESAEGAIEDFSEKLADEWKRRVPEGSSPSLSLIRRFYPSATDRVFGKMTSYHLVEGLFGGSYIDKKAKKAIDKYSQALEPAAVDEWLHRLLQNHIHNDKPYDLKDPYRLAHLFGSHSGESFNDFPTTRGADADKIVFTLAEFTEKDLPILRQWIDDIRELEPGLQADLKELIKLNVKSDEYRRSGKYLPTIPRLGFYCQTAYKMLTKDSSWRNDIQKLAQESDETNHNDRVIRQCTRLVSGILPTEAFKIAEASLNEILAKKLESRVDCLHGLPLFDRQVVYSAVWAALDGNPLYASLTPLMAEFPVSVLNDIAYSAVYTYSGITPWAFRDDVADLFMTSAYKQWSEMPEIDLKQNENLSQYIVNKLFKKCIGQVVESAKKWALEKPGAEVSLGVSPINLQLMDQILQIIPELEKGDKYRSGHGITYGPDQAEALNSLADLRVEELTGLIKNLYASYWQGEAESMFCLNKTTGMAYWLNSNNADKTRNRLLTEREMRRYSSTKAESHPSFKTLTAEELAELTGNALPELKGDFYVLPMNKIVGFMVKRAWKELLKADPSAFEREVSAMLTRDDKVPLSAKLDLLKDCDSEEYFGSLKELSYLKDQLAKCLQELSLTEKEIEDLTGTLLPIGFGMSDGAAQLTTLTPEQYYFRIRDRINAVLLPIVKQAVLTQGGKERRVVDLVSQKVDSYPIAGRIVDEMPLGQYSPMAEMTMIGRLLGGSDTYYEKRRISPASLIDGKEMAAATKFPFPEEFKTKDIGDNMLIRGIQAMHWNYYIFLLRQGLLPEHIRQHIYPKTASTHSCLMPNDQTVARPLQSELFERFGKEIEEAIEQALHYKPEREKPDSDSDGPSSKPAEKTFSANTFDVPRPPKITITSALHAIARDKEVTASPEVLDRLASKSISIPKLATYVNNRLESSHPREEITALFQNLHAGLGYWLFSASALDTDLPKIQSDLSQVSEPKPESDFISAAENSLDYLIRYVIFTDTDSEGRKKFDQFMSAPQIDGKLKEFTTELMDMITFYIENS